MCGGAKMKGGEAETPVVSCSMGKKILQVPMYLYLSFEVFKNLFCHSSGVGFIGLRQLPAGNQVKFCKPGNRLTFSLIDPWRKNC